VTISKAHNEATMKPHVRLRVVNFDYLRQQPAKHFEWLRIDANDNCNLKCVYCRVDRSDRIIEFADLKAFFSENVTAVDNLQFGCGMEPTIDERLADLMLLAANSNANPSDVFSLQTNGLSLHRHDLEKFKTAGLNLLSVSMDSANGETHKTLRGGSSIDKVIRNLQSFRETLPDVFVQIMAVVTAVNVGEMESLTEFAFESGIKKVFFREMEYLPDSRNIDHEKVRDLVVPAGEFQTMRQRVEERFQGKIHLGFLNSEFLSDYRHKADSFSTPPVD
jgi:molybdenum cofactor biosynthesis enzyme MoaA